MLTSTPRITGNSGTPGSLTVGDPVSLGTPNSVLIEDNSGNLNVSTPLVANRFLFWNGTNFVWSISGSGNMAIGNPVAGGTYPSILFIDVAGDLAQDPTNFSYQPQTLLNVDITDGATFNTDLTLTPSSAGILTNDFGTGVANSLSLDNARGISFVSTLGFEFAGFSALHNTNATMEYSGGIGQPNTVVTTTPNEVEMYYKYSPFIGTPFTADIGVFSSISSGPQSLTTNIMIAQMANNIQLNHPNQIIAKVDNGAGDISHLFINANVVQGQWTDGANTSEVDAGSSAAEIHYIDSSNNEGQFITTAFSAAGSWTDNVSITAQLALNSFGSGLEWTNLAIAGGISAGSASTVVFCTDNVALAQSQFQPTSAVTSFDNGFGTTSTLTEDVSQFDLRYINPLSQLSFSHGDNGSYTSGFYDPSSLSQSFTLNTADSSTLRWRLTPANSANGIFTVDSTGSHSYFNFSDGSGNTADFEATPTQAIIRWTDSSTLITDMTLDANGVLTNVTAGAASLAMIFNTIGLGVGTTPSFSGDFAGVATVPPVIFIGSGLDDAVSGGLYTNFEPANYIIQIDSLGTPDTFRIKKDNQVIASLIPIDGSAQVILDGITIQFAATTGHTLNDRWLVPATPNGNVNALTSYYVRGQFILTQDTVANNLQVGNQTFELMGYGTGNTTVGIGALNGVENGNNNTAIGHLAGQSLTNGLEMTFLGAKTDALNATDVGGIAIGSEAITTNNSLVIGSENFPIIFGYFGKGISSATPGTFIINATNAVGTDIQGGGLAIQDGAGTGTAGGSGISFATSEGTTTSSSPNSPTNVMVLQGSDIMQTKGLALNDQEDESDTDVTLTAQQHMVAIYDNTGPLNIFLPDINTVNNGKQYILKDGIGTAATWNLSVVPFTAQTIDMSGASYVMATNWQSITLVANRSRGNWELI